MSEKREQNPISDIKTYAKDQIEQLLSEDVLVTPTDPENEGLVATSLGRDFKLRAKLAAHLPDVQKASEAVRSAFESTLNNVSGHLEHSQTRISIGQAYVDFLVDKKQWADCFELVQSGDLLSLEEHSQVSGYVAGKISVFIDKLSKEEQEGEYLWLMEGLVEVMGAHEDDFDFMSGYAGVVCDDAIKSRDLNKIAKARQVVSAITEGFLTEAEHESLVADEIEMFSGNDEYVKVVLFYMENMQFLNNEETKNVFENASDFEKEEITLEKESATERWGLRLKLIESLIQSGASSKKVTFQIRDYLQDVIDNTGAKLGHVGGLQEEGSLAFLGESYEQDESERNVFDLGLRLIYLVELAKITASYDGCDIWGEFVDEKHEGDLTSIVGIMKEHSDIGVSLCREMIEICGKLDRSQKDLGKNEFLNRARDFLELSRNANSFISDTEFVFLTWFGWRNKAYTHDMIETQRDDTARLEAATMLAGDHVDEGTDWREAASMLDNLAERIASDENVSYKKVFSETEEEDDIWGGVISEIIDAKSDKDGQKHVGGSLKSQLADLVPNFLVSQVLAGAKNANLKTVKEIFESGVMRADKKAEAVLAVLES